MEPMFEMIAGLVVGVCMAIALAGFAVWLEQTGRWTCLKIMAICLALADLSALPIGRLLTEAAKQSPTGSILFIDGAY